MELDNTTLAWIWFAVGVILMLVELLAPGFVVIWFGLGAVFVAGGFWLGIIENIAPAFLAWFGISTGLLIALRKLAKKFFPSETRYQFKLPNSSAYNKVVDVIETVHDNNSEGRIKYQGTTWSAMAERGTIAAGKKAKLLYKKNLVWIVEPVLDEDDFSVLDDDS